MLERLAAENVAGVASTQIIFSTHSPLFMAMERFEEVRLLRRHRPAADTPREAALFAGNLDEVAVKLEQAHQKRPGTFTAATLKPKLHVIDPAVAEGFFACVAVIVEGESDHAALLGAAAHRNLSFEAAEIAIIAANGKNNIDKPCEIFRSLGIPVYIVWDNDRGVVDKGLVCNQALQRLVGVQEDQIEPAPDRVTPTYACFADKLETTLKNEIGPAVWQAQLDILKAKFGVMDNADAQKVPEIMKRLLAAAEGQNCRSDTLNRIVDAIFALKPPAAPGPLVPVAPAE